MGLLGRAILAFANDVTPAYEPEWLEWHDREHVPERLSIPGFLRLRRYVALDARPRYFFFYETESVAVLQSPAYLERLARPTEWTRRSVPHVLNNTRTACRVTASLGRGLGGALAVLETGPAAGGADALREWLAGRALPDALARPGVVAAHVVEADPAATEVRTEEKRLLPSPDALVRWLVLVEATGADALPAATAGGLAAEALRAHGAAGETTRRTYRLSLVMERGDRAAPVSAAPAE